jgi:hypothetical protein
MIYFDPIVEEQSKTTNEGLVGSFATTYKKILNNNKNSSWILKRYGTI